MVIPIGLVQPTVVRKFESWHAGRETQIGVAFYLFGGCGSMEGVRTPKIFHFNDITLDVYHQRAPAICWNHV